MRKPVSIEIPGSKSIAARALVCRLLGGHDTVLGNLPDCGDTRGMLRLTDAVRDGVRSGKRVSVDIGEGGTTLRFGMAACASIPGLDITLRGSHRLMQRPHAVLIDALRLLGAEIITDVDRNYVRILGRELSGGEIILDASVSSQYVSALMLAAPMWQTDSHILLPGETVSRPYIEMTAGVMRVFGAHVEITDDDTSQDDRSGRPQTSVKVRATGYPQCARYDIEGDWSGASYFFETRLIMEASGIPVPDFTMPSLSAPAESLQGDSRVAAIFAEAHGRLRNAGRKKNSEVNDPFVISLNDAPDLVPAVAVGLCLAGIPFRIEGVAHLRHKESDRMEALATELRRLSFIISTFDDSMAWHGERCTPEASPLIRTYQDHRMAMAFAPARLAFPSLKIEDRTVVDKSFPDFWNQLKKVII